MIKLVLISGQQGSGKTSTSNVICQIAKEYGYIDVVQLKFAGPLYAIHNVVLKEMEKFNAVPRKIKDGKLLQLLGTEWARTEFGDNVWSNILKKSVDEIKVASVNTLIVVDDCRFENEFNAFPEALRVRLVASEEVRKQRTDGWRNNTHHITETGLDNYAEAGIFDLYITTDKQDFAAENSAREILNKIK